MRPLTPANRSLRFLETGAPGSPQVDLVSSRAAVPSVCVASTDRLSFIDPFLHDAQAGLLVRGTSYSRRAHDSTHDRGNFLKADGRRPGCTRRFPVKLCMLRPGSDVIYQDWAL